MLNKESIVPDLYLMEFPGLSKTTHNIQIGKQFPIILDGQTIGMLTVYDIYEDFIKFKMNDGAIKALNNFGKSIFRSISFSIGK